VADARAEVRVDDAGGEERFTTRTAHCERFATSGAGCDDNGPPAHLTAKTTLDWSPALRSCMAPVNENEASSALKPGSFWRELSRPLRTWGNVRLSPQCGES
jgi:hypothetical protein